MARFVVRMICGSLFWFIWVIEIGFKMTDVIQKIENAKTYVSPFICRDDNGEVDVNSTIENFKTQLMVLVNDSTNLRDKILKDLFEHLSKSNSGVNRDSLCTFVAMKYCSGLDDYRQYFDLVDEIIEKNSSVNRKEKFFYSSGNGKKSIVLIWK